MNNPQVRERAYFYLGSFYIIMYWVGMGVYGLITDIRNWLSSRVRLSILVPVNVALFFFFGTLVPAGVLSNHIDPDYTNYQAHNRGDDWTPWDYAYNILASCDNDSILFTNGDNDTYPLWYLQKVKGLRTDVRIVNLSLLNTDWYIMQLKHEGNTLPIQFSDDFITDKLCSRDEEAVTMRLWPADGKDVQAAGISWKFPACPTQPNIRLRDGTEAGMIRIQDVMLYKIIDWVNRTRPIYFTPQSPENRIGLDDYLVTVGMVTRLAQQPLLTDEPYVDVRALHDNVSTHYQYRSLSDDVYKAPETRRLLKNYFIGFAQLCERYAAAGNKEQAVRAAYFAIEKTIHSLPERLALCNILQIFACHDALKDLLDKELANPGFIDGSEGLMEERLQVASLFTMTGEKEKADVIVGAEWDRQRPKNMYEKLAFSSTLIRHSLAEQACGIIREIIREDPSNVEAWKAYTVSLYSAGDYEESLKAVQRLIELAPGDERVKELYNFLNEKRQGYEFR